MGLGGGGVYRGPMGTHGWTLITGSLSASFTGSALPKLKRSRPLPAGGTSFGIGVGTLLLAVNVVFLGGYAFGCHSLRHLVGGRFERLSPFRQKSYDCVTCLNGQHQLWAWMSLFSVALTDLYIRSVAAGLIADARLF